MEHIHALRKALKNEREKGAHMMAAQTARPRGTDNARVIRVIETKALVGRGTADDPASIITQYWSLDGKLLADSCLVDVRADSTL